MKFKKILLFLFIISGISINNLLSQISTGELPFSWNNSVKSDLKILILPGFDLKLDAQIDSIDMSNGIKYFRFAHGFDVNFRSEVEGNWEEIPHIGRLFRLGIISKGAYSLNLTLDHISLPRGAKIWVYNTQKSKYIGAFTKENNNLKSQFAIAPVEGEEIIIEVFEPLSGVNKTIFEIVRIGHDFKGIFSTLTAKDGNFGNSGDCNVDVMCSQGNTWQSEKRSVCRLISNNVYLGSGTLINNTSNDGLPYLLTANHVIGDQQKATNTIFFFNYESPTCNGPDGNSNQTISGSTLIATKSDLEGHLDFTLVLLSSVPPKTYKPYYAGWSRNEVLTGISACIHHPMGDVKKISFSDSIPITGNYSGFDSNTHWEITHWEVGTTEGGSSGSPLFDSNHRIIGDLTGGEATCSFPYNDYFQKFSVSWNKYPNPGQQLAHWLDPENTQVMSISGFDPYIGITEWTNLTTLTNMLPGQTIALYLATDGGYLAGNNIFNDQAKAEYYNAEDYGNNTHIKGVFFGFGRAKGDLTSVITAAIWNDIGGIPGTQIATTNTTLGVLIDDVFGDEWSYVEFSEPIEIPGPFYAGVWLPASAGDTLALITNSQGESIVNTGWEMDSGGIWKAYSDESSWGVMLSNQICPVVGKLNTDVHPLPKQTEIVRVYPNPASRVVTLKNICELNSTISIYNQVGTFIMQINNYREGSEIDISGLETGMYFIYIKNQRTIKKTKLVIVK